MCPAARKEGKFPDPYKLLTPDDPLAAMLPLSKDVGDKEECCETKLAARAQE